MKNQGLPRHNRPAVIDESREPIFDDEGNFIGYRLPSPKQVATLLEAVQKWLNRIEIEDPELYKKVMSEK